MEVTLPKWPNREKADNFRGKLSYKKQCCWLRFVFVERFWFLQEFTIRLMYVSKHSVRRKYQKIQKIRKITMAVTKIGCFAPFGIGNISGSFWIQNHLNICIYVVHAISNIFVLVLGERKIPPTYKQSKVTDN